MKTIRNCIIILGTIILIGLGLLVVSFTIPTNWKNINDSASVISSEEAHESIGIWKLDNFMDDMIINQASCNRPDTSLIDKATNIYRIKYTDSEYGYSMDRYCEGDNDYIYVSYTRYWHGYIFILRPLLLVLNYDQIRTLNTLLQVILFVYVCILLMKNSLNRYVPAYVLMYYLISPIASGFSLQYTCIYYITFISVAVLLKYYDYIKEKKLLIELFFIQGALITFFDILTYPVFSLCMLLITVLICIYNNEEAFDYIKIMIKCFWCSVSWSFGYVIMWMLKWVLACIINGSMDNLREALNEVMYRSSDSFDGEKISAIEVVLKNVLQYKNIMFVIPVIVTIIYVIYKKSVSFTRDNIIQMISFFIVSIYPVVWYIAFKNHSYIHAWYTSRSLAASGCAAICGILCILKSKNDRCC